MANYFEHSQPLQASSTVTNILNHCEHPHLSSYQLMSHKGSQNAKAKALVISFRPAIMSISVPVSSDIQLTPEAQALIENILNQKLKEQDQYYLQRIRASEEEVEARRLQREHEFQADIAAREATLESVSRQLEEARVSQL